MALSDLIAEGNLGLLRAAELYNPKFGTRFLAYASVWIRQRIHRAITSQARVVRIPVWRSQRLRKLTRIQEEISAQLGRSASEEELAERLGMSADGLSDLQGDRIEVVSMDADLENGEGDGRSIGELLADASAAHPAARLSAEELHTELLACLSDLDDRELEVLALKFGLTAPSAVSFRELGRRMGVSHEWVRRIAELALVKVRRAFSEAPRWSLLERQQRREKASARVQAIGVGMGLQPAIVE
jgi:RNA polymerase sigma factor (sigma-70 family)